MLKWVVERVEGDGERGRHPHRPGADADAIDTDGPRHRRREALAELLEVDAEAWRQEIPQLEAHYASLGEPLPAALKDQLESLEKRLAAS